MKILIVIALLTLEAFPLVFLRQDNDTFTPTPTSADALKRSKRFLVYVPNGGILKFVTGYLGPIDIPLWQNINCLRNFQFQYNLPDKIFYKPVSFPGLGRSGRQFGDILQTKVKADSSRKIAYEMIEHILNNEGKNGRECLLRTICEVAETPVNHNGLIGELLQLFFTPGKYEKVHEDYRHARKVGLNRVNCQMMYPDCPFGHGLLDSISEIVEHNFQDWLKF